MILHATLLINSFQDFSLKEFLLSDLCIIDCLNKLQTLKNSVVQLTEILVF